MTIREMCDAYDVTPRALRFYEGKELLAPKREGQRRHYAKRDQARLKLILRGKRFGVSLEDIRQLLDLYELDNGPKLQLIRFLEMARERMRAMKSDYEALGLAIGELEDQMAWAEESLADSKMRA